MNFKKKLNGSKAKILTCLSIVSSLISNKYYLCQYVRHCDFVIN